METDNNPKVNLTNVHKFLKCENMWFTIDLKGHKVFVMFVKIEVQ